MLKNLVNDSFGDLFNLKQAKKNEKELWLDKYKPEILLDSAVHKNKTAELETILQKMFSKKASILLLCGPSGSAKTITLNLVAKKMNVEVQEWTNSISDDFQAKNEEYESYHEEARVFEDSQQTKFSDFLFRASRYNSLSFDEDTKCAQKLSIVKDFPNFLLREPTKLKELLLKYNKMAIINPLVFIVTDTEQSSNIKRKLFPGTLLVELHIEVVKFNAIAPTLMMKALQRICTLLPHTQATKQDLEDIVQQSNGDVRSACNLLQFLCTKSRRLKKTKRTLTEKKTSFCKKKSQETSLEQSAVGCKDMGMSLFRVLGKVLHCKRLPETGTGTPLPEHLRHHHRTPMAFDPDHLFHKACLSIDCFTSFLHQNFPSFTTSLEELSLASDCFVEADSLCKEWSARDAILPYQASLVTRGVMFAPQATSPHKPSWVPLHKPQMLSVASKALQLSQSIHDNFTSLHCNHMQLVTELLPFLSLITRHTKHHSTTKHHYTTFNLQQRQLLNTMSQFNQSSSRLETLDELAEVDENTASFNSSTRPSFNSSTRPSFNSSTHPSFNSSTHPSFNSSIHPSFHSVLGGDDDDGGGLEDLIEEYDSD